MSQSIWTQCAASSERVPPQRDAGQGIADPRIRRLDVTAHRVVESQYENSTRKLVDSDDEQSLLESLLDRAKPPVPSEPAFKNLHYLLFTPFRYPPLRHGSRFGRRSERGVWYGSRERRTCFAETAYYRLLFLEHSSAALAPLHVELTCFRTRVRTQRGVDLTADPFRKFEAKLTSRSSYADTHALGAEMRAAGVAAFLFRSARDDREGTNVALFEPCFMSRDVPAAQMQAWRCVVDRDKVEFVRRLTGAAPREAFSFPRATFLVGGALPLVDG